MVEIHRTLVDEARVGYLMGLNIQSHSNVCPVVSERHGIGVEEMCCHH